MPSDAVPPHSRALRAGVVLPIRSFTDAKARLAGTLAPATRAEIARRMADRVADAAAGMAVVVVSSAPEVREWAIERGFTTVDDPGSLDAAAAAGRAALAAMGCERAVIAHGDLPLARDLTPLATHGARVVALVPCHRDDGTNVLSVPVDVEFTFAYGPGSFRRHVAEAHRRGLSIRVVRDPELAVDVDAPEDLHHVELPVTAAGDRCS